MKIVIAPDSFKESMTAYEAAQAMEKGVKKIFPQAVTEKIPIADGGEGTVQALLDFIGGKKITLEVTGPLGNPIPSYYAILQGDIAVIEVAAACGLDMVSGNERNPMKTTSYGVGELIVDALDKGVRQFIIGLGGSATNDGGIGMAQALGAKITDKDNQAVPLGGEGLVAVERISLEGLDERLAKCNIEVASDVLNPLLGQAGATYVYGPQKGADEQMVQQLDGAMENYAHLLARDTGVDQRFSQGAGAAGGLGIACLVFLQASIQPGIDIITKLGRVEEAIKHAQLVLTGEGKMDDQTSFGKAIAGIAQIGKRHGIPVIAIAGADKVTNEAVYDEGVTAVFTLPDGPMQLATAMQDGARLTEKVTTNIMRLYAALLN